jgi:MinD superfamily P-loop ATPase
VTEIARSGLAYMINSDCRHCGICAFMCPQGAIREAPNQFVVRRALCNGCGECVRYCPGRAIVPAVKDDPAAQTGGSA